MVALADRPRAVTWVGSAAGAGRLAQAIAPQWLGATMQRVTRWALGRARPATPSDGNLFAPSKNTAIDGGQRQANQRAVGTVVAMGVLGLAAGMWVGGRRPAPEDRQP